MKKDGHGSIAFVKAVTANKEKNIYMSEPKWRRFEKLAYEIQKELAPNAEVKFDDKILGVDSGVSRQIDISIRQNIGQMPMLVVMDCKDFKDTVDVKEMEAFAGAVRDVRADKGVMISSNGFTPAAINIARDHRIDTCRLIDTESIDWKAYVTVPVFLRRTLVSSVSLELRNMLRVPMSAMYWPISKGYRIFSENGDFLGTVRSLLASKWNNSEIEREPGTKEVLIGERVIWEVEEERILIDILVHIVVERAYYLGQVPVSLRGFEDWQKDKAIITKRIISQFIEPFKIEQGMIEGWQKLENPDDLSIQPFISFDYSDLMSASDEDDERDSTNTCSLADSAPIETFNAPTR